MTAGQRALARAVCREWVGHGLRLQPADRATAEAGVGLVYRAAGLPPPRVVWVGSPLAGTVAALALTAGSDPGLRVGQEDDQVGAPVWSRLREPIWDAWWAASAQVGEPLWEEAAAQAAAVDAQVGGVAEVIWQQVSGQIEEADPQIWPGLLSKVSRRQWLPPWELAVAPPRAGSEVAGKLRDPSAGDDYLSPEDEYLDDLYRDSLEPGPIAEEMCSGWYTRGQHDAGALALIDVLDRAAGRRPAWPLAGPMLIGRSAGWWWPFERVVILTERPCALDLARDEQGRLHHPSGPLVGYPDGWGIWAWHGVRVPRQVIEQPDRITVEQIRGTRNLETRRVLLERYGLDRYLRDADAALLQVDEYGKLWRAELPDDEPLTIVEVVNATAEPDGTYASYLLRVPPTMSTARQAVAWTFGMAADDYHPAVQT